MVFNLISLTYNNQGLISSMIFSMHQTNNKNIFSKKMQLLYSL